jgi:hypothetical protein
MHISQTKHPHFTQKQEGSMPDLHFFFPQTIILRNGCRLWELVDLKAWIILSHSTQKCNLQDKQVIFATLEHSLQLKCKLIELSGPKWTFLKSVRLFTYKY